MDCDICFETFDKSFIKPIALLPCLHSICNYCFKSLPTKTLKKKQEIIFYRTPLLIIREIIFIHLSKLTLKLSMIINNIIGFFSNNNLFFLVFSTRNLKSIK